MFQYIWPFLSFQLILLMVILLRNKMLIVILLSVTLLGVIKSSVKIPSLSLNGVHI